jgi:hypothetical protein
VNCSYRSRIRMLSESLQTASSIRKGGLCERRQEFIGVFGIRIVPYHAAFRPQRQRIQGRTDNRNLPVIRGRHTFFVFERALPDLI